MGGKKSLVSVERIEHSILLIRGQKVLPDADLARLYGTTTKRLNEQVKRNRERFPEDFMFQLTDEEFAALKEQPVVSPGQTGWGGRRYPPNVFTEHGAIMAAGLINTPLAIEVSIFVVRAFVRLRQMLQTHEDLARRLDALEKKYDVQFRVVFDAIRQLMASPKPKKKQVGFHWETKEAKGKKAPVKKKTPLKKQAPPKKKTPAKKKTPPRKKKTG